MKFIAAAAGFVILFGHALDWISLPRMATCNNWPGSSGANSYAGGPNYKYRISHNVCSGRLAAYFPRRSTVEYLPPGAWLWRTVATSYGDPFVNGMHANLDDKRQASGVFKLNAVSLSVFMTITPQIVRDAVTGENRLGKVADVDPVKIPVDDQGFPGYSIVVVDGNVVEPSVGKRSLP
jgi:hypothetical protein